MTSTAPSITTTGKRKTTKADRLPFNIDGVTFHLLRPKAIVLARAAAVLDPARGWNEAQNVQTLLQFTGQLIQYVEQSAPHDDGKPTGRALIEQRLSDPEDALDLDDLMPVFRQIMEGWFHRPTGSPRASAPRRAASRGGASPARTR